jgi:hypothetical protein
MIIKNQEKKPIGTFVNISKGNFIYKNKEGEKETFQSLRGTIYDVDFIKDQINGNVKNKVQLFIKDGDESYIVQIDVNSGYFRGFCNSLKNGNQKEELTLTPLLKAENKTTILIEQKGKYLKHYFNKDFKGKENDILPDLDRIIVKGESILDNTKQVEYWKNWLISVYRESVEEKEDYPDFDYDDFDKF